MAVACVLVACPAALLLDEPTSGVNAAILIYLIDLIYVYIGLTSSSSASGHVTSTHATATGYMRALIHRVNPITPHVARGGGVRTGHMPGSTAARRTHLGW